MFERFTERARQAIVLAQDEARVLRHNYIGTEHILLGLLREDEGLAAHVLELLDVDYEGVRARVASVVGQGDEAVTGQIPFTPRAKKVLELSLREALDLSHNYIGSEHILLGLVRENDGVAARILLDFDLDAETIRDEIMRVLSGASRARPPSRPVAGIAPAFALADLAVALESAKRAMRAKRELQEVARLRDLQARLNHVVRDIEVNLARLVHEHQLPEDPAEGTHWEYDIRTIEGPSDRWVEQLTLWRKDGWELLTIVEEGDQRRALLERRVP